jgi:hypothetical protein
MNPNEMEFIFQNNECDFISAIEILSMPAGSPVKSKFQAIAAQDPPPIFIRA